MFPSFQRGAFAALVGVGALLGAGAQAQTGTPPPPAAASPTTGPAADTRVQPAASAPADKKKHASRAKTPPGKPPRGTAHCNQGDKAQRQRCLNDMYGPGAPRI
jgi:hypothetical protein